MFKFEWDDKGNRQKSFRGRGGGACCSKVPKWWELREKDGGIYT